MKVNHLRIYMYTTQSRVLNSENYQKAVQQIGGDDINIKYGGINKTINQNKMKVSIIIQLFYYAECYL